MIKDSKKKYDNWLGLSNISEDIKNELLQMNDAQIEEAFYKDIQFGTGGLRAKMGAGTNRLNLYTIRKCAEGYARYIEFCGSISKRSGVVIAYDNRNHSKEFAEESAKILSLHGIKTYLFDSLRPTPELSFAVRELHAFGGIVVTASHNPKEYNGYKIYDKYGCQCVPRDTDVIIKFMNEVDDYLQLSVKKYEKSLINIIGMEIDKQYYKALLDVQENPKMLKENVKIVYSPLHGAGNIPIRTMLKKLGYDIYVVENQCNPDGNFSNVDSMNPENKKAYNQAIELAEYEKADVVITTDPDCDRLGIAVLHQNKYEYLTGNQTGAILINYLLEQKKKKGTLPKNGIVFNTIVTSDLGTRICEKYGIEVESTLTGFKYIGDKIREHEGQKTFLFGYEESYGYLVKDFCRDKDAVQSSILIAEVLTYYKILGKTLIDVLNDIYNEFGFVADIQENEHLEGIAGAQQIKEIINNFRYHTPHFIESRKVIAKEDYLLSTREDEAGCSSLLLPKSNVIKLFLDDGSWIVVRPSGNEPKIKYYKNIWRGY